MPIFLKRLITIIISIAIALTLFYIGGEAGYQLKYRLELWRMARQAVQFNQSIIDMIKSDVDGGKTPEETFNLFIQALKDENVDLAVKYFVLDADRRANYAEQLNKVKEEGKLREYGEWFPAWEDMTQKQTDDNDLTIEFYWTREKSETKMLPDGAGGFIETEFPAGQYINAIDFTKNVNGIWKISNF